jgi:hypothetical protein
MIHQAKSNPKYEQIFSERLAFAICAIGRYLLQKSKIEQP